MPLNVPLENNFIAFIKKLIKCIDDTNFRLRPYNQLYGKIERVWWVIVEERRERDRENKRAREKGKGEKEGSQEGRQEEGKRKTKLFNIARN